MKRCKWALLSLLFFCAPAAADGEPLPWGGVASLATCNLAAGSVWTAYEGGNDCLRYFTGGKIDDAAIVIVVLRGDYDPWVKRPPDQIPLNTFAEQTLVAGRLAEKAGFPVIVLARPGTFGSTGDHLRRRQPEEFLALQSALRNIRARHRIGRFVLFGHSGGATAVAALLTMGRNDVACAVMTSGAYGLLERAEMLRRARGEKSSPGTDTTGLRDPYDPLDHVDGIVQAPERRIILIGDSRDQVTPYVLQERFHQALKAAGHSAALLEREAREPRYHSLKDEVGLHEAAACARAVSP